MTYFAAHEASLSLPCRADRGGYVIAELSGELSIASAPALREQLIDLLRAASHLILDLSTVEHADASGLAVLVGSRRRARLLGGSLRLAAPSPEVARVLAATGMDQHLNIYPTVRAAITGQPELPEVIYPSATVPATGHHPGGVRQAASVARYRRSGYGDGSAGPRPAATASGRGRRSALR
jgi:anti-anti-sigma factor